MEQVLLRVALVDHPPHPLGGRLGCNRESALAHALDLRGELLGHRLGTEAGERDADVLRPQLIEEILQHAVDAGVVSRAEREEPDLFVSRRFQALLGDAADVVRVALPRRPRDHSHLAEAAASRAAALDLQRQPVVHRLHEGHDRLFRLRDEVQIRDDAADDVVVSGLQRLVRA